MRILLDHNVPAFVGELLEEFEVRSAYDEGWHELSNGRLLAAANSRGFNVFVTRDRNLVHQQNLSDLRMALIVIQTRGQRRTAFEAILPDLRKHLVAPTIGSIVVISRQ